MMPGVVGASARAAIHSLARAGFSAWAVDQFGDRDLSRVATGYAVCPPDQYPSALPDLAKQFPPGPVLYTGGLENHPHVVAALAADRELWGNPPDVLARVRDPFTLFPLLAEAGFSVPRLVPGGEPCPTEGRWLRKPLRSAGGLGIRFAQAGEAPAPHHYFQEFIAGESMSVVFGGTTPLGVTQQLIGEPWLHARPFAYCGNIGPLTLPEKPYIRALSIGRHLALAPHWGVDCQLWEENLAPVEVNPRYTAAIEVIEHGLGRAAFQQWVPSSRPGAGTVGKAVYYAPRALTFPDSGPWDADLTGPFDPWRVPGFADIPAPGAAIHAGWPVLTIFATGRSPAEVRERLQSRAAELDRIFTGTSP